MTPHLTLLTRRSNPLWSILCLGFLSAGMAFSGPKDDGKTVLCFVSHKTSHGFGAHEYAAGCRLIGQWLAEKYPDAQVESRYSINWPEKPDEFFKDADSVIFFCTGGGGHLVNNHVPELDKVMRTGAGLACLHYAVEVPIGPSAKGMLAWMGGYFEMNWSVNPHWVAEFKVFPDHPAARGVKPFQIDDEWYFHMRFVEGLKGVTPILSAVAPDETMKRPDGPHSGNPVVREAVAKGEPQHVAWAYQRGEDYANGRGFGFTGLHYHWNWEDDNFRKTVLNGVAWTAGFEIPEGGIETEKPTREALEANALEFGGDQGRKDKGKSDGKGQKSAAVKPDPNLKPLFHSEVITTKTPGRAVAIDVELPGNTKELHLVVADGGNGFSCDWADWAEPRLVMTDGSEKKLTELDWKRATADWGQVRKNQSAGGRELKINGEAVPYGIGVHANSIVSFDLPAGAKRFRARGGLDDGGANQQNGTQTSVQFLVYQADPAPTLAGGGGEYVKKTSAAGQDPSEALDSLDVHPDLAVQLFASEPMITSPSSIDIDAKGRVWVCDVVNYRRNQGKRAGGDRILILEDTDGDAKADRSTVFYQGNDVDSAHGICVLGDRVIISAGEEVFSLYDRDGDGKADEGSKEVMFSRIGGKQHDHGIHAFHFGPDGRLYFNFGNAGQRLCDAQGNLITDIHGVKCTNENNRPYQEGMVFRCDPDGRNVEMLGWNFRNNWEIAVDSFGTIWQSDNDDDGNQAVRINYVMEFGNFGYKDEKTGAGWRDPRVGMEAEIPQQHWHQNDPGVVPNLLVTGAGSPTGLVVYEGDLLPEMFRGQMIHCDAGPNVVRSYLTVPDGAGYQVTETVDLVKSTRDRWFRPSDVCVAPDGSLFIADWYDPGVGGHGMGDIEKGRIFRVIPKGNEKAERYVPPALDLRDQSGENVVRLLASPNEAVRHAANLIWSDILQGATPALEKAFAGEKDARLRARALWVLARFDSSYAEKALADSDPNIQITALRALRQTDPEGSMEAISKALVGRKDLSGGVFRELALSTRHLDTPISDELWAWSAGQYAFFKSRWFLEALGIGAERRWPERLAALAAMNDSKVFDDLVWRARSTENPGILAALATGGDGGGKFGIATLPPALETAQILRSLQFQPEGESKTAAHANLFQKGNEETALFAAAVLGADGIAGLEGGKARLDEILAPIRGKAEFVNLAGKLNLTGFPDELASFVGSNPEAPEAVKAAQLLLQSNRGRLVEYLRDSGHLPRASALARALGRTGDRSVGGLLAGELTRKETPAPLKVELVNAMAMNGNSGRELLKLAQGGKLDDTLKPVAALAIARSPDAGLRNEGAQVLPVPKAAGAENFPPMAELVKRKGDAGKGAGLFAKATCNTCHRVKGEGIDFGPDLTQIGNKLSREAMFEAILYPNAAISHGFHGVSVMKKDGSVLIGYLTGETDGELQLRLPGGVDQRVVKSDIAQRDELRQSLMPPGLAAVIGAEGLADMVAWLETLR